MRLGVVIPCTKKQLPLLSRCFDSIENQSIKPDSVIVSCSSTSSLDLPEYNYSFPIKIITTLEKKNVAENRNIAALNLDTDIISFFSCEDIMHPQRLEFIYESFINYQSDIVLHSYIEHKGGNLNQTMFSIYQSPNSHVNTLSRSSSGCATVIGNHRIHHSHVSVTRFIMSRYKFREDPSNECRDNAIFCGDVLDMQGVKSVYLQNDLSCIV